MKLLLALSAVFLFAGAAAAQSLPGPIIGGHQLQPTQQQVGSREAPAARQWDRRVQPEVDRLYDQVMRASAPQIGTDDPPGKSSGMGSDFSPYPPGYGLDNGKY